MRQEVEQMSIFDQDLWCGKTCPEHSARTEEQTSEQFSKRRSKSSAVKPPLFLCLEKDGLRADALPMWKANGALLGEFSTRSFGEFPNVDEESHLSQILEDSPHQKYYLSEKACQGILRRAQLRGKELPQLLKNALEQQGGAEIRTDDKAHTLTVAAGMSGNNQPVICIQGNCIDRADTAGCNGRGWAEDMSYTLNTVDRPAVFDARGNGDGNIAPTITGNHNSSITDYSAVVLQNTGMMAGAESNQSKKIPCSWDGGQTSPTLTKSNAGGQQRMPDNDNFNAVIALDRASFNQGKNAQYDFEVSESGINSSLAAKGPSAVCSVDCRNFTESGETNGTLQAKENGGQSLNLNNVVRELMTVRRLTPLECERLQGFPDFWSDIGEWTDSKGKLRKESSDSARYKALGNSIALPSWFYVLSKLSEFCEEKTMASLFDGIGGFPLIWETLNGKGTCIWASEIEEFPIAVTKHHFPDEEKEE